MLRIHASSACSDTRNTVRPGYIFLISVLFVSAIAVSVVGSYLLLSIAAIQNGMTYESATQAFENASTCAERGLLSLFLDSTYPGSETLTLEEGSCTIFSIGGFGYESRTLCIEGVSGGHTRRMEIIIAELLPSIQIDSWQEVADISACSDS